MTRHLPRFSFHDMKSNMKSGARENIEELFRQAEENFREYPQLSKRYVVLARKIGMKNRIRFTKEEKMHFCKKCSSYLMNGKNSRIRLERGNLVLTCLDCGYEEEGGWWCYNRDTKFWHDRYDYDKSVLGYHPDRVISV